MGATMGTRTTAMSKILLALALVATLAIASEVEDLGAPTALEPTEAKEVGESAKEGTGGFFSALMTSGSFTMMQAGSFEEEEEDRDELGEANDWDLTNGGKCEQGEEAWVLTDAKSKTGKCVRFDADKKCDAQCYHQGKSVDETVAGAVCTKICRVSGASGAKCNVIKMVTPTEDDSVELGEGKTMYLTKSKVMQAGLKDGDLGEADPLACAGVANNRQ